MIAGASTILKFVRPGAVSGVFSTRDNTAEVFEVIIGADSKVVGKSLKDKPFPGGVIVAAIIRGDEVTIPDGFTQIEMEDHIILFANKSEMGRLSKLIGSGSKLGTFSG